MSTFKRTLEFDASFLDKVPIVMRSGGSKSTQTAYIAKALKLAARIEE